MSATATRSLEVFADITCPFTHVGLKRVLDHIAETGQPIDVVVRAWPLEWINEAPLEAEAVQMKVGVLTEQLGVDDFGGFSAQHWPATTIAALNLAAAGYERDNQTGLAVSIALRTALFEDGLDISEPSVLAAIAAAHDLEQPQPEASDAVRADYDDGRARGVTGSPHFWIDSDNFFCPALDVGHDDDGALTARLDLDGLAMFFARIDD